MRPPAIVFLALGQAALCSALPAQTQIPEIVLDELARQVGVSVAADEASHCSLQDPIPCVVESTVPGPFVDSRAREAVGSDGSHGWAETWQNTDVSKHSIRGKGTVQAFAQVGSGEEAEVVVVPESDMVVTFTVTETGPFSLDVLLDASEVPPASATSPFPPSATVQFVYDPPGLPPQFVSQTFRAGDGDENRTLHLTGIAQEGGLFVIAVYLYADRQGEPGAWWNHLGEARASFGLLLDFGDRDGDGLPDQWEEGGIDFTGAGIEVDLPGMGADPDHKDIFVELDVMEGAQLDTAALALVKQAFSEAPADLVDNPDGEPGINLHIVVDGDEVPLQGLVGTNSQVMAQIAALKNDYFGSSAQRDHPEGEQIDAARRGIFRYGICADTLFVDGKEAGGLGQLAGSDFVLAANSVRDEYPTVETRALAGHLMHEIGHTLGLLHGGQDEVNYKPNYLSVMNYAYSQPYLETSPEFEVLNRFWKPDFSRSAMATLEEGQLYDSDGLDGPSGRYVVYNKARFDDPDPVVRVPAPADSIPIDWNYNDQVDDPTPALDLNRRDPSVAVSHIDVLRSYSDWDRLVYPVPVIGERAGIPRAPGDGGGDLVLEELAAFADVPWTGLEELLAVFADDFESGSTGNWSSQKP